MDRPNIAYVVHSLDPGGTERLALDMALWFSRRYRMQIFCLDAPGQWAKDAESQGVAVTCLNRRPGIDLRIPVKIAALMKQRRIDLIHAHQYTPWFYAGLARVLHPETKSYFSGAWPSLSRGKKTKTHPIQPFGALSSNPKDDRRFRGYQSAFRLL